MCIGTLSTQRGSFKTKYYRKLTRCVEVMYPPHVQNVPYTPLCTCVGTYTALLKGCMVKNVLHLATKQGFLFNSESVSCHFTPFLARPKTTERRHQELQKAIQAELREKQLARARNTTSATPPSQLLGLQQQRAALREEPRDPHTPQLTEEGINEFPLRTWEPLRANRQGTGTAVYVEPPRAPTHGTN